MKKLSILLVLALVCSVAFGGMAVAEVQMGQAYYAAHGSYSFCVATVAMEGDVISGVVIDEFQYLAEGAVAVPNTETFTTAEGKVLASKRLNDESYSAGMAEAGSTQNLALSYDAIEEFVVGKTLADLEALVDGKTSEDFVDAVAGSTLTDTLGYLQAVIEAVKTVK